MNFVVWLIFWLETNWKTTMENGTPFDKLIVIYSRVALISETLILIIVTILLLAGVIDLYPIVSFIKKNTMAICF